MIFKFRSDKPEQAFKKIEDFVSGKDDWFVIEIQKSKQKRSLPQLRYYWGVIVLLISGHTGYVKEEVHQILGSMFLTYENNGRKFIRSTGTMNTVETEQYFEQCRLWAWHEMNIHIPLPNEVTEDFLIQMQNIYKY